MIDTFFSDGWLNTSGAKDGDNGEERASKKRKTGNVEADFTALMVSAGAHPAVQPGKKKAAGTGYDGGTREDVSALAMCVDSEAD